MTFVDTYLNQKSVYTTKDAALTHLQFQKTNMKNIQETVLKCQPLSNKELRFDI